MSPLAEVLERIIAGAKLKGDTAGEVIGDKRGLYVTAYPSSVVNVQSRTQPLEQHHVDALRDALNELGYAVVKSWVATQGTSWLRRGLNAGISFRIARMGGDEAGVPNQLTSEEDILKFPAVDVATFVKEFEKVLFNYRMTKAQLKRSGYPARLRIYEMQMRALVATHARLFTSTALKEE